MPVDHPRRQYVSNWWYIHPDHRIPSTFSQEQQELIQNIFDSLHHPEYIEDVKKQVKIDQYGQDRNAPAAGFFGTPEDEDFEFIYTGHHVTRRCNAHSDKVWDTWQIEGPELVWYFRGQPHIHCYFHLKT